MLLDQEDGFAYTSSGAISLLVWRVAGKTGSTMLTIVHLSYGSSLSVLVHCPPVS